MKITSDLTNLTTAILILTVQMFFERTFFFNTAVILRIDYYFLGSTRFMVLLSAKIGSFS
jgi:hypothetical protein